MTKYLGYPEPTEVNGHMLKLLGQPGQKESTYRCEDCGQTASYLSFNSGLHGCPGRPESLNHLSISAVPAIDRMSLAARRQNAREHWENWAERVGLRFDSRTVPEEVEDGVIMLFDFRGNSYVLRYDEKTHALTVSRTAE